MQVTLVAVHPRRIVEPDTIRVGVMSADFTKTKPFSLPVEMQEYLVARNSPASEHLASLQRIAAEMPHGGMRLGTEAGTFLSILVQAIQPARALEVGTFIGYSSLCIASAMGPDGRLTCCDVSDEWTTIAREHWEAAGVADKIELKLAPALETIAALPDEPHLDLVFIDADKGNYVNYYEALLHRLTPHGLMMVDNTMWSARVLDDDDNDANTVAVRAFNDHVAADQRTTNVTIPIGDGITLISHAT